MTIAMLKSRNYGCLCLSIIDLKGLEIMMKDKQEIGRYLMGSTNLRSAVEIFVVNLREGLVSKV